MKSLTLEEMIAECAVMASQCVDAPKGKHLFESIGRALHGAQADHLLLEALGRYVEFQVHDHDLPVFNMLMPRDRERIATPLRVELKHFLECCARERFT